MGGTCVNVGCVPKKVMYSVKSINKYRQVNLELIILMIQKGMDGI
jgi:pyruvate/2-oxoglutarate dehydrogenase complex dihydrolipoamide dehydrogenase (E3) component